MAFMRFLSTLLPIWQAASQEVYDDRTILSVLNGGSFVDVINLPTLLAAAGFQGNPRVSSFLSTTSIKTLKFAQCQIVETSPDSVTNAALCDYLHQAQQHLPSLVVTCGRNVIGELDQSDDMLNDPHKHKQIYLDRMHMAAVWQMIEEYPRKNITVAVIDQGVDFSDPDMATLKTAFVTSDGYVINGGWNIVSNSPRLTVEGYHGQFVSRVLAARGNNSFGMVGVAPSNVRLASLQVCAKKSCPLIYTVEAIEMAMDIGADVISISLGYYGLSYDEVSMLSGVMRRAQLQGIVLVSSAGNRNMITDNKYPCWYGGPNAICVAALSDSENYNLSWFSNYGDRVDIAAFGENIYVGTDGFGEDAFRSGTSLSAPIVSGAVAILLSLGVQPSMAKRILLTEADSFDTHEKYLRPGGGALNILSSVKRAIRMYDLRPIHDQTNSKRTLQLKDGQ